MKEARKKSNPYVSEEDDSDLVHSGHRVAMPNINGTPQRLVSSVSGDIHQVTMGYRRVTASSTDGNAVVLFSTLITRISVVTFYVVEILNTWDTPVRSYRQFKICLVLTV